MSSIKRQVLSLILFVTSFLGAAPGYAITALDSDFFGNGGSSGSQALDPDFFASSQGSLERSAPGAYGCVSVRSSTPRAESSAVGRVAQQYCQSPPQVRWIPHRVTRKNFIPKATPQGTYSSTVEAKGYFQICCIRKGRRGRPSAGR